MPTYLEKIIAALIGPASKNRPDPWIDASAQLDPGGHKETDILRSLNAAFLIALAGDLHPSREKARQVLSDAGGRREYEPVARFYRTGLDLVRDEVARVCKADPAFRDRLQALSAWVRDKRSLENRIETAERFWAVFCPEAGGIFRDREAAVRQLRKKRTIRISEPNPDPIGNPAEQVLFTANVLLTTPPVSASLEDLRLSLDLKTRLHSVAAEPQRHWYDHPVQIGAEPEKNEILYGLKGLDQAFAFERARGNLPPATKPVCVLSSSVTHTGLQKIARSYLEEEIIRSGPLENLTVYVFTEADTRRLVDEVLSPAASRYLAREKGADALSVFGVDGKYGRHYSFLKAVSAFWQVFVDPRIKATFKIDLDQVFPQERLVQETGASLFEHLGTPLWGAGGLDLDNRPVEMGMIAGALVNERDIARSLFTPDVPFPVFPLSVGDLFFCSTLPQALSTRAEMLTRYQRGGPDGKGTCIERIHVTGGTNGILVQSLRHYRPFTPTFMGRAEDQAYILSTMDQSGSRLAYAHKDGLIMRHDKEAFAGEAIERAYVSKLIGDYTRLLYFSAYIPALVPDTARVKRLIDPFTGCFVSGIPKTIVFLRFGLKASDLFSHEDDPHGAAFVKNGAGRIAAALAFTQGENSPLKKQVENEKVGWDLYYETLSVVEEALNRGDRHALELREKARTLVDRLAVRVG